MSINVNKITSTLAKLGDAELQQYAQMHKNDPYIMALAMSESNRRKDMRDAGQAAQGMQEQPKVVDRMVSEMAPQQLPEEMGIARIPAGEMNFAGGGIVAFADGGDVERYQVGGVLGDIPGYTPGARPFMPQAGAPEELPFFQRKLAEAREQGRQYQINQAKARVAQGVGTAPDLALLADEQRKMDASAPPTRRSDFETPAFAPKADAAPKADTGRKDTGERTPPAPAAAPAAGLPGLQDPAKLYQDILAKQNYTDPAAVGLLELEAAERAAAAAKRQAIVSDAERFKEAFKGRESRLAEREADIGKQRESNKGLAFLNAGLAIMSTPGGLATAIGKGAQVGTAQFAAGLDKIRSAQERLGEARDRLDDLKLNREETTAKELRDAENNYRRVAVDAQKRSIDGVRMAAGVVRSDAKAIYDKTMDLSKTMYQEDQQNKRTRMQVDAANRPSAEIQAVERIMKEKNLPFTEALAQYNTTKSEPATLQKLRADWLDPAKNMMIMQQYPNVKTFDDYLLVMGAGGGAGDFKFVGSRPAK